jgi:phosphoglycolate phosphatase-like HAD superfamily hydrolase
VVQSVLTGNLRALGVVKLAAVGLLERLDLEVAAFGDDHEVRAHLVEVARDQFRAREAVEPTVVLVGDTPLDVEAAVTAGAGIVAVATGRYSMAELAATGAPVVLPDLADTPRVVAAILAARASDPVGPATRCAGRQGA